MLGLVGLAVGRAGSALERPAAGFLKGCRGAYDTWQLLLQCMQLGADVWWKLMRGELTSTFWTRMIALVGQMPAVGFCKTTIFSLSLALGLSGALSETHRVGKPAELRAVKGPGRAATTSPLRAIPRMLLNIVV